MPLKLSDLSIRTARLNDVNDLIAGDQTAGGTGYGLYQSELGIEIALDNATAAQLSDTSVGTLYGGLYQYVRFISPGSNTTLRGQPTFWATTQSGANIFAADGTQYTVSIDPSASLGDGLLAGVALNAVTAAATLAASNFGWIQKAGVASCNIKGSPADNTVGDAAVVVTNTVTFDSRADATGTLTWGGAQGIKNFAGVFVEAPGTSVSASIKRVMLKLPDWFI